MDLRLTIEREKKVIIVSPGMFCFLLTSISINVPVPSSRRNLSNSRRAGCRLRLCAFKSTLHFFSDEFRDSLWIPLDLTSKLIFVPHASIWGQSCFSKFSVVLHWTGLLVISEHVDHLSLFHLSFNQIIWPVCVSFLFNMKPVCTNTGLAVSRIPISLTTPPCMMVYS